MAAQWRAALVLITEQKSREKAERVAELVGKELATPVTYDVQRYVCCGDADCARHQGRWQISLDFEIAGDSVLEASVEGAFRLLAPWTILEPGPTRLRLEHSRPTVTHRAVEALNVIEHAAWRVDCR